MENATSNLFPVIQPSTSVFNDSLRPLSTLGINNLFAVNNATTTAKNEVILAVTDMVEIAIYTVCLCIGGPLNLISFRRMCLRFFNLKNNAAGGNATIKGGSGVHLVLLKLNLNIADLMTMFIYTLSQIIWMITYQWYFGDFLCRVCKFFHTFSFYLNSFIIACFAIDKAFSSYNLKRLNARSNAYFRVRRMLMIAWAAAFLFSLPQAFIFRVVEPTGIANFKQCTPIWTIIGHEIEVEMNTLTIENRLTEERRLSLIKKFQKVIKWERVYNIAHLLFMFCIPVIIVVSSYVTILCVLNSFSVPMGWKEGFPIRTFSKFSKKSKLYTNGENSMTDAIDKSKNNNEEELEFFSQKNSKFILNLNSFPLQNCKIKIDENVEVCSTAKNSFSMTIRPLRKSFDMLNKQFYKAKQSTASSIEPSEVTKFAINGKSSLSLAAGENFSKIGSIALVRIAKARKKAKRQAVMILFAYLTFWTPYNFLAIINTFSPPKGVLKEIASVTLPFLNSMIVINPIVNPLIYGVYREGRNKVT